MVDATEPATIGSGTLVVIPTINEVENIGALITQVLAAAPGAHVVVVDDNSADGTGAAVQRMSGTNPAVSLIERPGKLGLGTAYLDGFRHALERDYDFVVTMDADFSHQPEFLPAILTRSRETGVDLVIGSRYTAGGRIVGWGPLRRILSRGAKAFARGTLGLKPQDCTGGYRCYARPLVTFLEGSNVAAHGYSALIELLLLSQRAGYSISEVPITFVDRMLGTSKVSSTEIFRGVTTVLRLRFKRGTRQAGAAPTGER